MSCYRFFNQLEQESEQVIFCKMLGGKGCRSSNSQFISKINSLNNRWAL